ncbi:unnamed protein product [Cylindrotheca closterium]|uniref:Uncharacterized protein n=1 Tax=Cylindrotheca closterium TaxID=2856 RepID=A0AAD2CHA6_9STRA|nr:unnamed protein product [Cylindrotheca closterium]
MLQAQQNGRNFTIFASGGSLTAGAAKHQESAPDGARYYSKLASYLNMLLLTTTSTTSNQSSVVEKQTTTVQAIGQEHGARTGLHTAIFFDSFIPTDTDLLLWELELILETPKQTLLVWLQEVSRMKTPAKVILLYYWDTLYTPNETTNEIGCQVFQANSDIARQFDFVLGHVNVASYIKEGDFPGCSIWKTCPLLPDTHHASKLGHLATPVYHCGGTSENKSFSLIAPLKPMKEVRVVLLVFKRHGSIIKVADIDLFLNGANTTTNGELVPMQASKDPTIHQEWPCHLVAGWSAFADTYWYVFAKPQPLVHLMRLCTPSKVRSTPKIQTVAFW